MPPRGFFVNVLATDQLDPSPGLGNLPRAVSRIRVRGLFERLDYDLALAAAPHRRRSRQLSVASDERLTLIYGPNGTGKTTLLRLVFHALSPSGNGGHRSAVGKV